MHSHCFWSSVTKPHTILHYPIWDMAIPFPSDSMHFHHLFFVTHFVAVLGIRLPK